MADTHKLEISAPRLPDIDTEAIEERARLAMAAEAQRSLKLLVAEAEQQQAALRRLYQPLEAGFGQKELPKLERSTEDMLREAELSLTQEQVDRRQRQLVEIEPRAGKSQIMNSCVTAWAPHAPSMSMQPQAGLDPFGIVSIRTLAASVDLRSWRWVEVYRSSPVSGSGFSAAITVDGAE